MEDVVYWLALRDVRRLSRLQANALLERFGSPQAIFGRPAAELAWGCPPSAAGALERRSGLPEARAELERARALGLQILARDDPEFPELLREIPDPPLVLYLRGALPGGPTLTVVGSRRATAHGLELAHELAGCLATAGVTIVSGLAYGIDAAAHTGALEAGGATLAVLASGLDRPSPAGNRRLARRILEQRGGWLSEYPPGQEARAYRFPERNRLISGLAPLSLIVEARERSGSLWTARHAAEQGRDVAVVPGPVGLDPWRGSNRLLQDGAAAILDADDLLRLVLPGDVSAVARAATPCPVTGDAARILRCLREAPGEPDVLARDLGIRPSKLAELLLDLELEGLVLREGSRLTLGPRARDALRQPGENRQ